jgi:exodeoxyribonuclease VII large subunit
VSRLLRSSSSDVTDSSGDSGYLSISAVSSLFKDTLEREFPQLLFRGEVSEASYPGSGHLYLTIKDDTSQLSCVVWAGMLRTIGFKPKVGMSVRCHGRPTVYNKSGRLQVVISRMFEDGEGALRRKFIELQKRLEAEGFFAKERKRELPFLPKAVGIVTSETGAVIHDMMVKVRERFPSMVLWLAPARVQGDGAAAEIAAAIRALDRSDLVDVIIVARGGGSLEDLWAFNEEEVVKAVFACSRPVVSGVGHEVDVTLCDLVADVRAPTPTAAAEMVVPKRDDLLEYVKELSRRLNDTDRWLQPRAQRVDELSLRLRARLMAVGSDARLKLRAAESSLARIKPDRVLALLKLRVDTCGGRLSEGVRRMRLERAKVLDIWDGRRVAAGGRLLLSYHQRLSRVVERLEAVSPQAVLNRGFAVVYSRGGHVRSIAEVAAGDPLDVRVADGVIKGLVKGGN